jgi:2-methylisocitrate lyase-like PEP mutase family enzyme
MASRPSLIERAGFRAVYTTGFGTAASLLGRPDIGLLTLSEMVDNTWRIAQVVEVPVVADADDGSPIPVMVQPSPSGFSSVRRWGI